MARAEHEVADVVRVLCELLVHFEKHQALHLRLSVCSLCAIASALFLPLLSRSSLRLTRALVSHMQPRSLSASTRPSLLARHGVRLVDWTSMLAFEAHAAAAIYVLDEELEFLAPELVRRAHFGARTSAAAEGSSEEAEVSFASDMWFVGVLAFLLCAPLCTNIRVECQLAPATLLTECIHCAPTLCRLAGRTPFVQPGCSGDSRAALVSRILDAELDFSDRVWSYISAEAREFISLLLASDMQYALFSYIT